MARSTSTSTRTTKLLSAQQSPQKKSASDYIEYYAPNRLAWRTWLAKHHQTEQGVWLIYYKKDSGKTRVEYDESVEEAICFGWIDSVVKTIDEQCYKQLFTPRKAKSNWSKVNKERVEKLFAQNLIMPAGMLLINLAKETGTWDALNDVEQLVIPEDMQELFDSDPQALVHWNTFSRSVRRGILEYILNAKRPETRIKRITDAVRLAHDNIKYIFDKK